MEDKGERCTFVAHSKESESYKLMTGKRNISKIVMSDEKGASKWISMVYSPAINKLDDRIEIYWRIKSLWAIQQEKQL